MIVALERERREAAGQALFGLLQVAESSVPFLFGDERGACMP